MYLCSETPGKSGELGRLAEGGRVDAGKGEAKAVDEAEVKAGVVAEAWTTLATREEEMVVLIPEALEGGGVGAVGGEVDLVEDGVRRTAVGGGVGAAEGEAAAVDLAGGEVRMSTPVGGGVEEEGVGGEGVEGEVIKLQLTLL